MTPGPGETKSDQETAPSIESREGQPKGIIGKTQDALSNLVDTGADLLGIESKAVETPTSETADTLTAPESDSAWATKSETTDNLAPVTEAQNQVDSKVVSAENTPEIVPANEQTLYELGFIKTDEHTETKNETLAGLKFPSKYSDIFSAAKDIVEFSVKGVPEKGQSLELTKPPFFKEGQDETAQIVSKSLEIPTDPALFEKFMTDVVDLIQAVLSDKKFEIPPKNKYTDMADQMEDKIENDPKYAEYKNSPLVQGILALLRLAGRLNFAFESFTGGDIDTKINATDSEYKNDSFETGDLDSIKSFSNSIEANDMDLSDQIPKNLDENASSTMYASKKLFNGSFTQDTLALAAKLDHSRFSNPTTGNSELAFNKIKNFNNLKNRPAVDLKVGTVLFFSKKMKVDGKERDVSLTGILVRTPDGSIKLEYYNKFFEGGKRELVDLNSANISLRVAYEPLPAFLNSTDAAPEGQADQAGTPMNGQESASSAPADTATGSTAAEVSTSTPDKNASAEKPNDAAPLKAKRSSKRNTSNPSMISGGL